MATIDKKSAKSALVAETRKQQIARRLKVSERVLEQYFQSKQAEVEDELPVAAASSRAERSTAGEKRL